LLEAVFSDVRFAVRWLRKSPGFAVVAVASLAIGIGFNTALFTLVDALLFRPLPVERPDRLVDVFTDMLAYSPSMAAVKLTDRSRLAMGETIDAFRFFQEEAKVVTASRREQSINEAPVAVDVISQEDIQASGVTNIWDLMRYVPGVDVVDGHTPHGNRALVTLRGFTEGFSRNVLVLVDGRPVYDVNTGSVAWEQLPAQLQDIDRINLGRQRNPQPKGQGALANQERELGAAQRAQALGITQAHDWPILIENHRSRHDRPGQWASSGLVHASQQ